MDVTIITSPNIKDTDELFRIYVQQEGNQNKTNAMFYEFLKVNSPERQTFLDSYCTYEYMIVGKTAVLQLELKQ